jgi:hypothetical protein
MHRLLFRKSPISFAVVSGIGNIWKKDDVKLKDKETLP